MKILVLWTEIRCSNPMAHGILQSFYNRQIICSAGTHASGRLNTGVVNTMKEIGIDISHHTSDLVEIYLGKSCDYVITVCSGVNENCRAFTGKVKHRIHIGFDEPSHITGTSGIYKK